MRRSSDHDAPHRIGAALAAETDDPAGVARFIPRGVARSPAACSQSLRRHGTAAAQAGISTTHAEPSGSETGHNPVNVDPQASPPKIAVIPVSSAELSTGIEVATWLRLAAARKSGFSRAGTPRLGKRVRGAPGHPNPGLRRSPGLRRASVRRRDRQLLFRSNGKPVATEVRRLRAAASGRFQR